jgi:ubiquinone/menaquinone biosynthesis C-methylase UbiE
LRKLLRDAGVGGHFKLLDVGAASGDTARVIQDEYRGARVTSLDCNPVNLGAAPHPKVLADAFQLPFPDCSFDYVLSSLFLHHFTDERVADLLREFNRVARRAVLISDLERHVLPYLFMKVSKAFFGWGFITVHDGLLSVRAAFRARELLGVAQRAGLNAPRVQTNRPAFRLTLVAKK